MVKPYEKITLYNGWIQFSMSDIDENTIRYDVYDINLPLEG